MLSVTFAVCAMSLFATAGCGKKASETAANEIAERAMEKVLEQDGQDAEVKIDSKTGSMTIKSKEGGENVDVKVEGNAVTVKTNDAETTSTYSSDGDSYSMTTAGGGPSVVIGKGAKVPDDFPKDIPVYPGSEIQMSSADPANHSFVVQATTADPIDKVGGFYQKEMKAQGWTEAQVVSQTGEVAMQMLSYEKADASAVIMVTVMDGKTSLSITTGMQ